MSEKVYSVKELKEKTEKERLKKEKVVPVPEQKRTVPPVDSGISKQLEALPDDELEFQREAYPSNKNLKNEWKRRQDLKKKEQEKTSFVPTGKGMAVS